jgi:hypothetical protein
MKFFNKHISKFFLLGSFFLSISCKEEEAVVELTPPIIETVAVYSVSNADAEANVDMSNVNTEITEVGVVWSDKANPTLADKSRSGGSIKEDQSVIVRLDGLTIGRTYYVRSYYVLNKETVYGKELTLVHNFTDEWSKAPSPVLLKNEYIGSENAFLDYLYGGIKVDKINRTFNYTTDKYFFPNFYQWDPRFIQFPILTSQTRFNQINASFSISQTQAATMTGAGHYRTARGEKFYLKDIIIRGVDGYKWQPEYPGADANTSSVGIGSTVYILENIPEGKLWRFTYEINKWQEMKPFPYKKQAKTLMRRSNGRAYCMIEPEEWQSSSPLEFYEYNPANDQWTKKANFPAENRRRGVLFNISQRIFYGTGQSVQTLVGLRDIWEYKPATDTWKKVGDYPGGGTINLLAVNYFQNAFIGCGQQVIPNAAMAENIKDMADVWFFVPKE